MDFEILWQLVQDGILKFVVDCEYFLIEFVEVYWYVDIGWKVGNVIINILNVYEK